MAKSTCLHIQDRESGPIRVVEIPWISVRIGRAVYCEVRLSEHGLADVACRLKRHGKSWELAPIASPSPIWFEGRPLDHSARLPYDVPFHVGRYCLILRQDQTAEPDWDTYGSPYPRQLEAVRPAILPTHVSNIRPFLDETAPANSLVVDRPSESKSTRAGAARNPGSTTGPGPSPAEILKHRWVTRWNAAGAEIKSRSERHNPPSKPARAAYGAGFAPVPLKEARAPHTAPVATKDVERRGEIASAGLGQSEPADFRIDGATYETPHYSVPESPSSLAVPFTDAPELAAPPNLSASDVSLSAAAPLSFWDNWAPTDEMMDSLRQGSPGLDGTQIAQPAPVSATPESEPHAAPRSVISSRLPSPQRGESRRAGKRAAEGDHKNGGARSLSPSPHGEEGAQRAGEGELLESRLQAVPGPAKAGTPTSGPAYATSGPPQLEEGARRAGEGDHENGGARARPRSPQGKEGAQRAGEEEPLESRLQAVPGPAKAGTPTSGHAYATSGPPQREESRRAGRMAAEGAGGAAQETEPSEQHDEPFDPDHSSAQPAGGLLFAAPVDEKRRVTRRGSNRAVEVRSSGGSTDPGPKSDVEPPPRLDRTVPAATAPPVSPTRSPQPTRRPLEALPEKRAAEEATESRAPRSEPRATPRLPHREYQYDRERALAREREWERDLAEPETVPRALAGTPAGEPEWPSALDILAVHRASQRSIAQPVARGVAPAYAQPTVVREPGQWVLPAWLAGPPIALFVLVCGIASCILSLGWASDSYSASIMTDRLLTTRVGGPNRPLPDGVNPPNGTWVKTTAQHLAHWALFLSRSTDATPGTTPVDVRGLFERALQVSPLNPTARLALAQLDRQQGTTAVTIGQLGLSRDVAALASTASWLLAAGRKDAALGMYRRALEVASHRELSRYGAPRFSEDPASPRYLLPGEDALREVVRALVTQSEWAFSEWSAILPKDTTVPLVAARLLHEQGKPEAEQLVELYLRQDQPRGSSGAGKAVLAAARAESHALLSHWREAEDMYRQAIEQIDDDTIRRSWWFNLADIALRLDDEGQRQAALRSALAATTSDDITRRATEKERSAGPRARLRSTGTKAN
jgi:hypothetical protein